ncbi:hypothetical protein CQW23_03235 [Capsicum baccatum]|uniref:Ribosome biogenesis protein NOP53 n=1 Tax=Capsicum baccatum TaxID=33114 RepID=A0A2G2XBB3_CAPBA|nr:hypothetical protein CQW23_03235 [Capsicum baccatum]
MWTYSDFGFQALLVGLGSFGEVRGLGKFRLGGVWAWSCGGSRGLSIWWRVSGVIVMEELLSWTLEDAWTQRPKMLTQVEKNRRARRKEQLKAEAEAIKATQLFKEIDSLPDIIQEIEREEGEKQKRHLRCVTAKKEKLKSCPPRLGKRKFEPAPAQVLLSEEITGSLRKLKGCCTLARDRFKSLEKRGLVVPSKKSSRLVDIVFV